MQRTARSEELLRRQRLAPATEEGAGRAWFPPVKTGTAAIAAGGHTALAISRSLNFWILPVDVFGSSANTT